MNPILIGAMLLAASVAVMAGPGVRFNSRIDISQPGEDHSSSLGVVNGVRSCGGPGRLVQWRVDGCTGDDHCRLPGDDQKRPTEYEFVPSQDIGALGIRINLVADGEAKTVYERAISDSSVQGGESYIVNAVGGPTNDVKGETITLQYILYNVENEDVEICSEADFEIY